MTDSLAPEMLLPLWEPTPVQRVNAQRIVAGHAKSVEDCRDLLGALGLLPMHNHD